MSTNTAQEAEVTVTGVIQRLVPCAEHAGCGDGEQHYDGAGRPMQNPNGYRHDCGACLDQPRIHEQVEGVRVHE